MKEKILKTILICVLVMALTMVDFIVLGQNIVIALTEQLEYQGVATDIKNVEFDAYFKDEDIKTHTKQSVIKQGDNLILDIIVKEAGVLEEGRIKIENSNFKVQPTENQYVKNVNTDANEIELNQIITGNHLEISIPVKFEKIDEISRDYLSKETKVILMGSYKNDKDKGKMVTGERIVRIDWKEETEVSLEQGIEKFINLAENKTLIQQNIKSQILNNTLVQGKEIDIVVPEIGGVLPENIDVLINGQQASQDKYFYDKHNKTVTIQNSDFNNKENDEYKVIYYYLENIQVENLSLFLNSKIKVSLYTDEVVEKDDIREVEIKQFDNRFSVNTEATNSLYKGYLYTKSNRYTQFEEKINFEISTLEGIGNIEFKQMQDFFLNEGGEKNSVNGSSYIRSIKLKKSNLEAVLEEDFSVSILGDGNRVLSEINKDSEWDENGDLIISVEENLLENIRILCSQPTKIGTLTIEMQRFIKGETGYNKSQLKNFTNFENAKVVVVNEKEIPFSSTVLLEDTCTEARLEISSTNFSTLNKNENIQILGVLKSDSEKYDLYKNPYVQIKLPDELKEIDVYSVNVLYGDGLNVEKVFYDPNTKSIHMQLQGEQVDFRTSLEEGIQIVINADLTFQKNIPNKEVAITILYKNENASEPQYETSVNIGLNSRYGAILYSNVSGYNGENTVIESTEEDVLKAQLDVGGEERQVTVNQSFINNYEEPIDQITVIGNLQEDSSNFEAGLIQDIEADSEGAKIYYSNKEDVTADDDSWQEDVENLEAVKSYKVELNKELQPSETMNMTYQLGIPAQLDEGAETYQSTNVIYSYRGQELNASSSIQLYTDGVKSTGTGVTTQEDGIKTEIVAISGNKELTDGEEIFEGQPVKYTVKVTNNTGKDLNNFSFVAEHSNVVYYVQKEQDAEITDNPDNPEIMIKTEKDENAINITKTMDIFKNGETAIFEYQFSPKKKNGIDIIGNIKVNADNLQEKVISTISNKIKDAKVALEILNGLEENYELREDDVVPFDFYISNYSEQDQRDVIVNIYASDEFTCINEKDSIETDFLNMLGQKVEVIELEGNKLSLKFANLKAKQQLSFCLVFQCKQLVNGKVSQEASIYSTTQLDTDIYYSNTLVRKIKRVTAKVTATQNADMKEDIVKIGDKIIYTAEITNEDTTLEANGMKIEHIVTEGNAKIEKAYLKKQNNEIIDATITNTNNASVIYNLKPGEKVQYIAEVLVWDNPDEHINYEATLQSYISLSWEMTGILNLPLIEYEMEREDDNNDDDDMPFISGLAWQDSNKNGERDQDEEAMSNIEVKLLNNSTGEVVEDTVTDEDGLYQFDDLDKGNYIVMFVYDSTSYSVTQYKKDGVKESKNSDAVQKEKDGKIVAMTEVLNITDKGISNIDVGFVKNAIFDLSLDKTVKKVIVKNESGTDEVLYNKAKLAKVEIGAKYIEDSLVVVEYEIEVKNEGEIQGYVKDVVDYMPKDLDFSSDINKDWYIGSDGNLHNISLSNKVIKPGESRILTLTLTKQMTSQKTGRSVNIAEIASATNELSIKDKDSTPGNRMDNEDDISTAELLVSIQTGALVISTSVIFVLVLAVVAYVVYRKRKGGK